MPKQTSTQNTEQTTFAVDGYAVTRVSEPLSPGALAYMRWAHCLPHWYKSEERAQYDALLAQRERHITDAVFYRTFGKLDRALTCDQLAETCLQQANGIRQAWERDWFAGERAA